jgi:hypothetical protein
MGLEDHGSVLRDCAAVITSNDVERPADVEEYLIETPKAEGSDVVAICRG